MSTLIEQDITIPPPDFELDEKVNPEAEIHALELNEGDVVVDTLNQLSLVVGIDTKSNVYTLRGLGDSSFTDKQQLNSDYTKLRAKYIIRNQDLKAFCVLNAESQKVNQPITHLANKLLHKKEMLIRTDHAFIHDIDDDDFFLTDVFPTRPEQETSYAIITTTHEIGVPPRISSISLQMSAEYDSGDLTELREQLTQAAIVFNAVQLALFVKNGLLANEDDLFD